MTFTSLPSNSSLQFKLSTSPLHFPHFSLQIKDTILIGELTKQILSAKFEI